MADRSYSVRARTTGIYGRVLASCRQHHWIVDAPDPGEEVTPGELFLGAVASCGAELIERMAKEEGIALGGVRTSVEGTIPEQRIRDDVSIFSKVQLDIELEGVDDKDAAKLVEGFKSR